MRQMLSGSSPTWEASLSTVFFSSWMSSAVGVSVSMENTFPVVLLSEYSTYCKHQHTQHTTHSAPIRRPGPKSSEVTDLLWVESRAELFALKESASRE